VSQPPPDLGPADERGVRAALDAYRRAVRELPLPAGGAAVRDRSDRRRRTRRLRRLATAAAVLVALLITVAVAVAVDHRPPRPAVPSPGPSTSRSPAPRHSPVPGSASPSARPSASRGDAAAPPPSTPPATPTEPGPCPAAQLTGRFGTAASGGGSSQRYGAIGLTNAGPTCVLDGYPGLSLAAADGSGIPVTVNDDTAEPHRPVTLPAGATAWSTLHWDVAQQTGPCPGSTTMLVTPPGGTGQVAADAHIGLCGDHEIGAGAFQPDQPFPLMSS
jgi:hypothetical protein